MRKLTITRKGSIVGYLQKLNVYVADYENGDLDICDISCRKIGEIKNDESATFEIDNDINRVFVIADKGTKDLCNDSIHVAAGDADVYLKGKCKFNPFRLNAFTFDGEPDEMAKRYRGNANRNGSLLMAGIVIVGILLGIAIYSLPIWG